MALGLFKRRDEDIKNSSRVTHPIMWFVLALLCTAAFYGLYVKLFTPKFQGKWHLSGKCLMPRYDWLSGCLVGMDLSGGGPAFFYVAEKGQTLLLQYEGRVKRSEKNPDELIVGMPLNSSTTWQWRYTGEKLMIKMVPKGNWIALTKGPSKFKYANFNAKPDRAGVEPFVPKVLPWEKKEMEEKLKKAPLDLGQ